MAAPAFVRARYNLPCTPECTLCHGTNAGGFYNIRSTVVNGQPLPKDMNGVNVGFATSLKACGFEPTNQATWPTAFQTCENNPTLDLDQDGHQDMQEVRDGTDPNDPAPDALICGSGPEYGCVRVARGNTVDGCALVTSGAVLFAGIAFTRRRRRH
jgi:hypothetical protein